MVYVCITRELHEQLKPAESIRMFVIFRHFLINSIRHLKQKLQPYNLMNIPQCSPFV